MSIERVKTIEEAESIAQDLRKRNRRIVTTNGSYDVLHIAHVHLLGKARAEGTDLIVLVNSDESVRRFKGPNRPIIPENERAEMLAALKPVDYVVIFPQDKPLEYLARIKPHIHVKGGSWDPERLREEIEFVARWDGEYKTFEPEKNYSTTNLIRTILERGA